MRVLMINRPNALTVLGGDTIQLQKTGEELQRLGVEVRIAFGSADIADLDWAEVVHLFNLQTPDFTMGEAERAHAAGKPIALSTIFWDFGADQLLARSARWKTIATCMGRPLARWLAQRRVERVSKPERDKLRAILSLADVWLPNSQAEAVQLHRLTTMRRTVHVVPNAVDPERCRPDRGLPFPSRFDALGLTSKGYILIAARIDPDKNQLAFCEALSGTGFPVVLCGPTPDADYAAACRQAGATIVEAQTGDGLDAAMLHARVHALPSYRETPGLANLEAAALGSAIVSTSIGSTHEYFADEAEYCLPWSPTSMRSSVERAWRQGPSPKLAERIRQDFTWRRAAQETLKAYELVLGHRRPLDATG